MGFETIIAGALAGAAYALLFYLLKGRPAGEPLDLGKLLSTVIVGVGIGTQAALRGQAITEANVTERILAFSVYTAAVEKLLDATGVLSWLREKLGAKKP